MLWALGSFWEGATGDFTIAPNDVGRASWSSDSPHLLALLLRRLLLCEKGREPLCHPVGVPTPPPYRGRNRVSCNFISEPSPAQPRPRFELIAKGIGVGISTASLRSLHRPALPLLLRCRVLTAAAAAAASLPFFFFLSPSRL